MSRNSRRAIAIEYASWPVEQPGTQTRIGGPSVLPLTIAGKTSPLEILEHLRIAEEAGDVDQHVPIQGLGFVAVALEELRVVRRRRESAQHHAAGGASLDRGVAVLAEIDARALAQRRDDALELVGLLCGRGFRHRPWRDR